MRRLATLALIFINLLVACSRRAPSPIQQPVALQSLSSAALVASPEQQLMTIRTRARALSAEIFAFWRTRGVDWTNGGFYGSHDLNGVPDPAADKGLIQQARHLWAFAAWHALSAEKNEETPRICDHTYAFLLKFYQPEHQFFGFQRDAGGTRFTDPMEQFYANAYAIYGLSQYGLSFAEHADEARKVALSAYRTMVRKGSDSTYGGFDQTNDPWYFSEAQKKAGMVKDYNTHLHILEAFTALHQLTHDEDVRRQLNNLLDVFLDRMIGERPYIPLVFKKDWSIAGDPVVSYGHDIEAVWLIHEALKEVGRGEEPAAISRLIRVGKHAAAFGFDREKGGCYEEGLAGDKVTKTNKIWWAQAEALLGLFKLYQWTADVSYLQQISLTLDWIEKYQRKADVGEWYWEVAADGAPLTGTYNFIGGLWKTSYHNGRALLLLDQWIGQVLAAH